MQCHKDKLMTLIWRPDAPVACPLNIDKDDLFCNAVTMHCMAVVHGTAPAPISIADFWNTCVKALNAHCTKERVPLVAAASLAYATDCLIERKTAQKAQPLERPNDDLTEIVPALGECWACLCAHINTDVTGATEFVLEHNLSLAKLLSACTEKDSSNAVVNTLASRLGYRFTNSGRWWKISPDDEPQEQPSTVLSDPGALTDKSLYPSTAKEALSKLDHMLNHMLCEGWLRIPGVKPPKSSNVDEDFDESGINELKPTSRGPYHSANHLLRLASQNDSDVPRLKSKAELEKGSHSAVAKRWHDALLCLHASSMCLFHDGARFELVGREQTTKDGKGMYLATKVRRVEEKVVKWACKKDEKKDEEKDDKKDDQKDDEEKDNKEDDQKSDQEDDKKDEKGSEEEEMEVEEHCAFCHVLQELNRGSVIAQ